MAANIPFIPSMKSMRVKFRCPQCLRNTTRSFTTFPRSHASIAADPTSFEQPEQSQLEQLKSKPTDKLSEKSGTIVRIVPASPSYFNGRPRSTDKYLKLQTLLRRYQTLPTVEPGQAPRVAWRNVDQFRLNVSEHVKNGRYRLIQNLLQRLNRIHPSLMPPTVRAELTNYQKAVNPHTVVRRPQIIDEDGKVTEVGRRKRSSARVSLIPGDGQVQINGKSLNIAFGRVYDRESALWPLKATERLDKYNVFALVKGGGLTGQAEAITHGLGKALLAFEPALKPALRKAGVVARDARKVERKKPGNLKARKKQAWVKR